MELCEISADEYGELTNKNIPLYCRENFLELNAYKVDHVRYFLAKDNRKRIAFALGEQGMIWVAPWSAPFSMPVFLRKDTDIIYLWEFFNLLNHRAKESGIRSINIFLPPDIYAFHQNVKTVNALLGNGYCIQYADINYAVDLKKIDMANYKSFLHYNARKNLKIALDSGLDLVLCENDEQKMKAYDIIRINREYRGFPLRMTCEQLMKTIPLTGHEFFLVMKEDREIASAIVYHVTENIAQVIYWGNIPDVGEWKPMNYLAYCLTQFYQEKGFSYLDIGPSSEQGIPNFGLCSFKEGIGCEVSSKFRFQVNL